MRVYHFVNAEHGLEDLQQRRLKIATLNELNDPFELFGVNLSSESLRRAFKAMKNQLSVNRGLLCFSRAWHNPVQWSHYADRHRGLCLGFDVPDEILGTVSYSRKRLLVDIEHLRSFREHDSDTVQRFLFTKYAHWRYENEVRVFVTLQDRDPEKQMYFVDFSEQLKLTQVIVGAESTLSRENVREALGDIHAQIETFKVCPSFKTFKVIRQRNGKLWS